MTDSYAAQPDSPSAHLSPEPAAAAVIRRVAVIGDIGGHREELVTELRRLGADPSTLALPADLVVVQVGDLIHRGPDSVGVVALVDRYLSEQPDQWVQLVGNHEAQYLRDPAFEWPERIDRSTADVLRGWWRAGRMRVAVAVPSTTGDHLVTHAGLTSEFWRQELGGPSSAERTAYALNALIGTLDDALHRAGEMLGGGPPMWSAGPLWASAPNELVPSWLGVPLPFNQVHGHTAIHDWQRGVKRGAMDVTFRTTGDPTTKIETTRLDGGDIIGVDPCHGYEPRQPWQALELAVPDGLSWSARTAWLRS